jgi:hypothetical protein
MERHPATACNVNIKRELLRSWIFFSTIWSLCFLGLAVSPAGTGTGQADEVWACGWTTTAAWGKNGQVFMTRYQVKGNILLSGSEQQPDQGQYQILQNNQYGLVASSGISDERDNKSNVVVSSVLINKKTGQFRELRIVLESGVPNVVSGICMRSG